MVFIYKLKDVTTIERLIISKVALYLKPEKKFATCSSIYNTTLNVAIAVSNQ